MENRNPHVVMLPFPAQGHIKPMLMLAELLSRADFSITFVNTEQSHRRLAAVRRSPGINFVSIPDGLPPDHPRSGPSVLDLLISTSSVCKPIFKDLIASMSHAPPTCIISDGIMSFAVDVAAELGIPAIAFRTYNATSTWVYFHLEKLIQEGQIPVVGEADGDEQISCIPGLENILRRRDLPSICRLVPDSEILQFFITQASKMRNASALILNTFEELESPMLSRLRSIFPAVHAIGPLHSAAAHSDSTSLLEIDQSCLGWLDTQPSKSVVYVSFGSVAALTRDELIELWYGLVNSHKPFLWAIRPDLIWDANGPDMIPEELRRSTMERGRIVGWAPQEEVLAHDAVGGFLTHCGWNSVLEGICAGKPMVCRPMVAEQQVNGRCVSEMWKLGLDMNCVCDRSTVERVVRDLMEGRKEEMLRSSAEIAKLASDSVGDGGSSRINLNNLIADIKLLHSKGQN